jgi:microcystin-dependent protein
MATPFLGQISIFPFNFAPKGWALANGQLLPIAQNTALFSILGTTYGGNGTTTFALPNLQGATPIHWGTSPAGNSYVLGQTGGEVNHTLLFQEMPAHNHLVNAYSGAGDQGSPAASVWAQGNNAYNSQSSTSSTMASSAVSTVGGGQPHNNMPPYLVVSFAIALTGVFPSRN